MRVGTRRWDGTGARDLARELRAGGEEPATISTDVAEVIRRVRSGGDAMLLSLGERFDGARPDSLRVDGDELARALASIDPNLRSMLELARANVEAVARMQVAVDAPPLRLPQGHAVTVRTVPVAAAAIYAPGGRAPYPSSVLMGVVPARVAGVERVVVASPPRSEGLPHPAVLAAAALAGADEVLAAGGAQAVAALAYGTETIEAVDVIAGPGGPWVQEAKLQVSRQVGIDGYAGPSELMVICDADSRVEWIALDLCAQAEHGPDSPLVVACSDSTALERIAVEVASLVTERSSVADAAVELIEVPDLAAAAELARHFAPEHLQVDCAEADAVAAAVPTAGCIFVGATGATAFGDYAAGSNHTLPTGGAGRFTSPLGPATFTRRISEVHIDGAAAALLAPAVESIAAAEGFPVHGESARARGTASGPAEQAS